MYFSLTFFEIVDIEKCLNAFLCQVWLTTFGFCLFWSELVGWFYDIIITLDYMIIIKKNALCRREFSLVLLSIFFFIIFFINSPSNVHNYASES